MAVGLDGGIALDSGDSKWITSELSRKDVHKLRATNEAILTGTGTILKDNPSLTSRNSGYDINDVKHPLRVVIDRNNYLNGEENIFSSEAKTLVFTTKNSKIKSKNSEICIMSKNDMVDLNNIMSYLAEEKSINTLMIESGSILLDALLAQELIDELILYKAPKLLGKDRNTFSKFGQKNQKLSTIGFKIGGMENLGEDLKVILTPN
jgi:diaminohydroxyphosphoribosylaminopyrimidine deaminase/5-amino-6-(5-phosphoribosylamino)uracil reductase